MKIKSTATGKVFDAQAVLADYDGARRVEFVYFEDGMWRVSRASTLEVRIENGVQITAVKNLFVPAVAGTDY